LILPDGGIVGRAANDGTEVGHAEVRGGMAIGELAHGIERIQD
jgi:hypothetical protein